MTRIERDRCDNCKLEVDHTHHFGWQELSYYSRMRTIATDDRPKHLCSPICLAEYALAQLDFHWKIRVDADGTISMRSPTD